MSVTEARKEVSKITQALLAIKPAEEALEIARSIPDGDWFELIDDVPPIELIAREVQLLTAFRKRDELVRELVEALTKIEQETIDHVAVRIARAVITKAKAIDAGEETRS